MTRVFLKGNHWFIFWTGCAFFSLLVFVAQGPDQPVRMLSSAAQYYLGQQVAQGRALYRDLAWNKTPLSIYINSLCFSVCKDRLIPAVILNRMVYWAVFFAGSWPLFGLGLILLRKRALAALGVLFYLCFPFVLHHLAGEPDWHIPMTTFGLYAVYFNARAGYFGAGLSAGLAFLSWQPGLIFFFIIMACILCGEVRPFKAAWAASAGFGLPAAIFIISFLIQGVFLDFISLTFVSTRHNIVRGFLDEMKRIPFYADLCYSVYKPILFFSAAGLILHGLTLRQAWSQLKQRKAEIGIALAALMTIAYSLIDFQHCDDFLVFIPWISLYAVYALRVVMLVSPRFFSRPLALLTVFLLAVSMARSVGNPVPGLMRFMKGPPAAALTRQKDSFRELLKRQGHEPDDKIVCLETALPCLLTAKPNAFNKYLFLLDDYCAAHIRRHEPGAAAELEQALSRGEADFVFLMHDTLQRRKYQEGAGRLKGLLEKHYQRVRAGRLDIWIAGRS